MEMEWDCGKWQMRLGRAIEGVICHHGVTHGLWRGSRGSGGLGRRRARLPTLPGETEAWECGSPRPDWLHSPVSVVISVARDLCWPVWLALSCHMGMCLRLPTVPGAVIYFTVWNQLHFTLHFCLMEARHDPLLGSRRKITWNITFVHFHFGSVGCALVQLVRVYMRVKGGERANILTTVTYLSTYDSTPVWPGRWLLLDSCENQAKENTETRWSVCNTPLMCVRYLTRADPLASHAAYPEEIIKRSTSPSLSGRVSEKDEGLYHFPWTGESLMTGLKQMTEFLFGFFDLKSQAKVFKLQILSDVTGTFDISTASHQKLLKKFLYFLYENNTLAFFSNNSCIFLYH